MALAAVSGAAGSASGVQAAHQEAVVTTSAQRLDLAGGRQGLGRPPEVLCASQAPWSARRVLPPSLDDRRRTRQLSQCVYLWASSPPVPPVEALGPPCAQLLPMSPAPQEALALGCLRTMPLVPGGGPGTSRFPVPGVSEFSEVLLKEVPPARWQRGAQWVRAALGLVRSGWQDLVLLTGLPRARALLPLVALAPSSPRDWLAVMPRLRLWLLPRQVAG